MMKRRCPKCGSENIEIYDENVPLIHCLHCGYDELGPEELPDGLRKTPREKGKFTPDKMRGKKMVQKK